MRDVYAHLGEELKRDAATAIDSALAARMPIVAPEPGSAIPERVEAPHLEWR